MSKSSTMVLAVGAGYLLGRKHKLRMAVLLAGAAATGSAGGLAGKALRSGGKLLASPQVLDKLPPEAAKIADLVSSDLAQAGKAAAKAAVSSRIDGLTSAIYDRAEAVRGGPITGEPADGEELPEDDAGISEPNDDEAEARTGTSARRRPAQASDRSRGRPANRPQSRRPAPDDRDEGRRGSGRRPRTRSGSPGRTGR